MQILEQVPQFPILILENTSVQFSADGIFVTESFYVHLVRLEHVSSHYLPNYLILITHANSYQARSEVVVFFRA